MGNPFIMFISIFLGSLLGRVLADCLLKNKDKEKEND